MVLATLLFIACFWSCSTPEQKDEAQQEVLAAHEMRRIATVSSDNLFCLKAKINRALLVSIGILWKIINNSSHFFFNNV